MVEVCGGVGNDLLDGGNGDDTLVADAGFDTLRGGNGDDRLTAAEGMMLGRGIFQNLPAYLGFGGEGNDVLFGGMGATTLHGGDGDDFLGADMMNNASLFGGMGNDTIYAGAYDPSGGFILPGDPEAALSSIFGGSGNDFIRIYNSGAVIDGGSGNDTLYGSGALSGNVGDDQITVASTGAGFVYGGAGNDTIQGDRLDDILHGGDGNDLVNGGGLDDILFGGTGNDTLNGEEGLDVLSGGEGDDSLRASDGGTSAMDNATGDTLIGGAGMDQLWGDRGGHTYYGGSGNDLIRVIVSPFATAVDGDSVIDGGSGDDSIYVAGDSQVTGGAGRDVFAIDRSTGDHFFATMTIMDFVRGEDRLDANVFNTNPAGMLIFMAGNGPLDFEGAQGQPALAWGNVDTNRIAVFLDGNGDGETDAMFVVNGIGDLQFQDISGWDL